MNRILVVDDDPFFLELVSATLTEFDIHTAENHEQTLQKLAHHNYDLFLIDTMLGDDEQGGYKLCKSIRRQHPDTPVVFASCNTELSTRLHAYSAGANDYIAKPYNSQELEYKLSSLLGARRRQTQLHTELLKSQSLINSLQLESYQLQAINRFLRACQGNKDLETLITSFQLSLSEFGTSGVLQLQHENTIRGCDCTPTPVEIQILEMHQHLPRIYHFGNNRAIFCWPSAQLLVRELGALVDTIAILMDALQLTLDNFYTAAGLLNSMDAVDDCNRENQQQMTTLVHDMTIDLQDSLVTLGLISSLEEEEEKAISDLVQRYGSQMLKLLEQQAQHNRQLRQLMEELKASPAQETEEEVELAVELF